MCKLLCFMPLFFFSQMAAAMEYYVATNGSNNNSGKNINAPFGTIQYALDKVQAGDTIKIMSGIYKENLNWKTSGRDGHWITLKSYNNEPVTIDGGTLAAKNLLNLHNVSFVLIQGIIFQNNYQQGAKAIIIDGEGSNITINKCVVRNVGWINNPNANPDIVSPVPEAHGILIVGRTATGFTNIKVLESKIYDIVTGQSEALTIAGNVYGFELTKDTVYNTKNIGIDISGHYDWTMAPAAVNQARNGVISQCVVYNNRRPVNNNAPAGIYIDGAKDIKVLNNRVFKNGNGISIGCEFGQGNSASGIILMNNMVYANDTIGIVLGSNISTNLVKNTKILNNTIYRNGAMAKNSIEITLQHSDSCVIANNIIIPSTNLQHGIATFGYTLSHLTVYRNMFYRDKTNDFVAALYHSNSPAQFKPLDTIINYPAFIDSNRANPNLDIAINSPCINKGANNYSSFLEETDAANRYRIVNGTVDIGAYERQDGGCPGVLTITNDQLLKGKLAAAQQIIFNMSNPALFTSKMLLSSPSILLKSPVKVLAAITVSAAGCK